MTKPKGGTPDNNTTINKTFIKFRTILIVGGLILVAYLPLLELGNGLSMVQSLTTSSLSGRSVVVEQQETDVHYHNNIYDNTTTHLQQNASQQPIIKPRPQQEAESDFLVDDDGFPQGILSEKSQAHFFQPFRDKIDAMDLEDRCRRFQFTKKAPPHYSNTTTPRRIFYGSLIANEPWEVLEIVATEMRDIFTGMVFVESNRTQNFYARNVSRTHNPRHLARLQEMFGVDQLQIRPYVNEDATVVNLLREHAQRQEILRGWKELGMLPDDVGYIADVDETFSRDFLRAIQYCPYVEALDYESHHCWNIKTKMIGSTRVFETSPECVTQGRSWFHPDLILGACIEEIGNPDHNIVAPRDGFRRQEGYGRDCDSNPHKWEDVYGKLPKHDNAITNDNGNAIHKNLKHPLWSAGDFRAQCGGRMYEHQVDRNPLHKNNKTHSKFTAFHLHNFFVDFQATRHKYRTYGHPRKTAMTDRLEVVAEDLKLMVRCVLDQTDGTNERSKTLAEDVETQHRVRIRGGLNATLAPWPIYFQDATYRRRKHLAIKRAVLQDEHDRLKRLQLTEPELELEELTQALREAKRKVYDHEKRIERLKKQHKDLRNADG